MMALCGCIPFYMDIRLLSEKDGVIYCTLHHVHCLLSYKCEFFQSSVLVQVKLLNILAFCQLNGIMCLQNASFCLVYNVPMKKLCTARNACQPAMMYNMGHRSCHCLEIGSLLAAHQRK